MIPAPLGFFKVKEEKVPAHSAQFDETKLRVAPKAFDAIDVVFAAGKLVLVVVNAPVFVTAQEQAIVAEQTVGIDGRFGKHLSPDDRLQFCPGAVFHHAGKDPLGFAQGRLLPPRLSSPMTGVLPPAPRPRRPRTRRGPK